MDLRLAVVFFVLWGAFLGLRRRHIALRERRERNFRVIMRRKKTKEAKTTTHSKLARTIAAVINYFFKALSTLGQNESRSDLDPNRIGCIRIGCGSVASTLQY